MSSMPISKRAQLLKPSPILMLAARAAEMKAAGQNVISLSIGEPDWDTYDNIKEAAIGAIRVGMTKYTPPAGIPELRKAVAQQVSEDLGIPYEPSQVTVSTGTKFILYSALQALVNPGEEVILVAPFWASYSSMVELGDGVPRIVVCGEKEDFKLTPELLKKAINPKTKALLLNSPSNPTGKVYTREQLKGLAEVLRANPHVMILSDDIYNRLTFEEKIAPHILHVAPDLRDRTVILNGASKSYAMTGWRCGWALGHKDVITAMSNYQSQTVSCASSVSQQAAVEAVRNSDKHVAATVVKLKERRDFLVGELTKIDGLRISMPEGAFYLWVNIEKYMGRTFKGQVMKTSSDISLALLNDAMVALVPGDEFGLDGYVRICYTLEKEKGKEAVDRIRGFFQNFK
jgi:aspartate aminotransferase